MTRADELVSVVLPAYNQAHFIRTSVTSALSQTYRPLEVIVVNDGSTDNTALELEPFLDRIQYISQPNAGLSAARNSGIRRARGEWIALLDTDDVWHTHKIEVQVNAIRSRSDVALVGSPAAATLPDVLDLNSATEDLTLRDFFLSARMGPSSALIRRRVFNSVGLFDESLHSVEDRDMWLRIAAKFSCVLVDSPCWWYRRHTGQMSLRAQRMFTNYRRVLDKFFAAHPEHVRFRALAMSYLYFDAAMAHFDEGQKRTALFCLARSAAYRPTGLGDTRRPRLARLRLARRILVDEYRRVAVGRGTVLNGSGGSL